MATSINTLMTEQFDAPLQAMSVGEALFSTPAESHHRTETASAAARTVGLDAAKEEAGSLGAAEVFETINEGSREMVWPYNTDGMQVDHDAAHAAECRAYDESDVANARAAASAWDLRIKTIDSMERQGGSFVRALAHAARMADDSNYEKLKATFADYFAKYADSPVLNEAY